MSGHGYKKRPLLVTPDSSALTMDHLLVSKSRLTPAVEVHISRLYSTPIAKQVNSIMPGHTQPYRNSTAIFR